MAGITANSASVTMESGDTAADNTFDGFILNEQITLATSPTGSTYSWGLARPSGATSRSDLSSSTAATPRFIPDAAGYYVITCTVDSNTDYILRISVTASAATTVTEALRLPPKAAGTVTTPTTGFAVFNDSAVDRLRKKDSSGTVTDVDPGARTGTFTLSSGAATISDTSVTANTVIAVACTSASSRGTLTYTFNAGTSVVVASSDGSDGSAYRYALIG
jgi:hypothetical protein